jgi:glycosyltransferase involved in cell wall biosynthesis
VAFLPNVNIATILATSFTGIPSVVGERSDPSTQPMSAFWRFACSGLYRFADALTVQTCAVARKIPRLYGGVRRIEVMPNPLPAGLLAHEHSPGRNAERRVLLSLGRLAPEKQVDQIIAVFSWLAPGHADWDLHIYGKGPLERELQAQVVELGLQERVSFKGPTRQPWRVMEDADLFVMNSRFEGFPNALLEAMGVGLPCVTADCPSGPREISREGQDALLFAPGDLESMRDHLRKLMDDATARERLGQQARKSVSQRYSLESVLTRWDSLLASVASKQ